MSNKNRRYDHKRINLQSIIKRLPIQSHLNESQSALIVFSTIWNKWVKDNLPNDIGKLITLNSFKNGILSIRCTNAVAASQLKHLQVGLINAFNDEGHHQITRLKFEIDKKTIASEFESDFSPDSKNQHFKKEPRKELSHEALDTLEHCEKGVKNEKLSISLKKLHKTLRNL